MEEKTEVPVTQEEPEAKVEPQLTPEEIADLKHKAEVSSQNFERAKKAEAEKKELEQKLLQASGGSDVFSDEGLVLKKQIDELNAKLMASQDKDALDLVKQKYPAIGDKLAEFEEFKQGYPGVDTDKVAKIFLAENDLLEPVARKGLEQAGRGTRVQQQEGYSTDDLANLRNTNFRKYLRMIKSGEIK